MNTNYININILLTCIIIILVIYFLHLNSQLNQEGIKGLKKKIRNIVKSATNPIKTQLLGQIKKISKKTEKKMKKVVEKVVKKSTKPLIGTIKKIENSVDKIKDTVMKQLTKVIDGMKTGIVNPLLGAFKYIGLMFAEIGLLLGDFFVKVAEIPMCVLSYIVWVIRVVKDELIKKVVFPMIKKIFSKIFGRFYPETIVNYFVKFVNWYINLHFYVLSQISTFLGLNSIFAREECFNFTMNISKRTRNMRSHLIDAGNSFADFGKFNF